MDTKQQDKIMDISKGTGFTPNIKIGLDIEKIDRFVKLPYDDNIEFYNKHFSTNEIEYCLNTHDFAKHITGRFCVKEAFMKAYYDKVNFADIEVINDKIVRFKDIVGSLSISYTDDLASAVVIIEGDF